MKATVLTRYGPPEMLQSAELPRPEPRSNQILIRVHAAAINPIDWRIRSGSLRFILPGKLPLVLGYDVSGEVVERAPGVTDFELGDEVFCYLDGRLGGGYAQYVTAGQGVVVPKPAALSHEEAASVPLAAITALRSLVNLGHIAAGHEVLINGASGGVGIFAVQIAKALGARVTGVCGPKNLDFVRGLGVDHPIDYTQEDFTRRAERYDIVLDAVAKRSYPVCRQILKPRGRFVTTLPWPKHYLWQGLTLLGKRRSRVVLARPSGDDLRRIATMLQNGQIRSVVEQVFPLDQAAEAHRLSEAGHVRGKLVLRMPSEADA